MSYVTIRLPFNACGDDARRLLTTAWLFKVATHRLLRMAKEFNMLPSSNVGWKSLFRKAVYEVIPNRRYTDGVIILVKGVYESCRELGVDFKEVELGDWLMFQQTELEHPCRNITLRHKEFHITTIDYNGETNRTIVKPTIPKSYSKLINRLAEEKQPYCGRVVIRDYGVRNNTLWVRGEIHVTVKYDFYVDVMKRYTENNGRLYGGVDVNTDRINLVIVDVYGRLRDKKTFWFTDACRKGYPRHKARVLIGMAIHDMLKYAYHHGVKTLFLEDPEVLGRLRLLWIRNGRRLHRNYNWKKTIFRTSIIDMIAMKAPLYSIKVRYVDPKGTTHSKEHDEIMRKYRLDRHTASAYLIALKGLNLP